MLSSLGFIGVIFGSILLYYIIREGVEDGVLRALEKHEKSKSEQKSIVED